MHRLEGYIGGALVEAICAIQTHGAGIFDWKEVNNRPIVMCCTKCPRIFSLCSTPSVPMKIV